MEETIFIEGGEEEMITIQGVRVDNIGIEDDKIHGKYSLITDQNKVVAMQNFNDYGGIKIDFSVETKKLVNELSIAIKKEIETTFGIV